MVAQTAWCELCRFDDLLMARAVATSIASMEFDVQLCTIDGSRHIVQVEDRQVRELADVLDEIIEEQREFDRMLARRSREVRPARVMAVVTITGAAELVLLLAMMDW